MEVDQSNTDYCTIDGVLYSYDERTIIIYPSDFTNDEFEVPDSVEKIDSYAFESSELSNIFLPDGVTEIGNNAFYSCEYLSALTIPDTIETLGARLLSGCTSLTELTLCIENPAELDIDKDIFEDFDKSQCELYVPYGCKKNYSRKKIFQGFSSIIEMDEEEDEQYVEVSSEDDYETGEYFERLPGYQYTEGKEFYYYEGSYHCSVIMSSAGFFLKVKSGGYYFLSALVDNDMSGHIWIHNKRERAASYDVSYTTDNITSKHFGHFKEFYADKKLTYKDLETGKILTLLFKTDE